MRFLTRFLSQIIIRYIEKPVLNYQAHQFVPLTDLRASLQRKEMRPLVRGGRRGSPMFVQLLISFRRTGGLDATREKRSVESSEAHASTPPVLV